MDAGHFFLVKLGSFATHEAVLVSLGSAISKQGRIADVEDPAGIILVGIVSVRSVSASEGASDVPQKEGGSRGQVQGLEHALDFLDVLRRRNRSQRERRVAEGLRSSAAASLALAGGVLASVEGAAEQGGARALLRRGQGAGGGHARPPGTSRRASSPALGDSARRTTHDLSRAAEPL